MVVGIEGGDVVVIDVGVSNGSAVAGITVEPQARLYVPMPGWESRSKGLWPLRKA